MHNSTVLPNIMICGYYRLCFMSNYAEIRMLFAEGRQEYTYGIVHDS